MGSGAWLAAACCGSCGTENGDAAIGTFTNFAFSASMSATALLTASAVGPETLMCRWLAGSGLARRPRASWYTPFTSKTAPLLSSMRSLPEDLNSGSADGRTYTLSSINAQRAFVDTPHCRWTFLTPRQRESPLLRFHNMRC